MSSKRCVTSQKKAVKETSYRRNWEIESFTNILHLLTWLTYRPVHFNWDSHHSQFKRFLAVRVTVWWSKNIRDKIVSFEAVGCLNVIQALRDIPENGCEGDYNNNNSELYLHDNNTALQKRRKHHNYSDLIIRVQFQLRDMYHNIHPIFQ